MKHFIDPIKDHAFNLPAILAQDARMPLKLFESRSVDPALLIGILIGLALLIGAIVYGTYRYQRWKQFKIFEEEMKTLGMDTESEGTLSDMVCRYNMDEPVQVLFSARLFDEMASKEILRVLGSPGSAKAKQQFIDTIYHIRTKTYHADWTSLTEENAEEAASELAGAA